jgi:phage-related protein
VALTVGELNGYLRLDDGAFTRALDEAGARFQRFKSRLDVQLQELEHSFKGMSAEVKITADTKPAERDVRAFIRRMNALKININVNVSIVQALARLDEIQDRVREVSRLRANVSVRAESADTLAALRAITTLIDRIDRARPGFTVSANTARAEAALRRLEAAQRNAGNDRGLSRITLSLSGIGSAASGAASGLAGVASSAGLIAAGLGAAIPVAAGLVATLVNIAPAAAVGATAVFALAGAFGALKVGLGGISGAFKAALAPSAGGGGGGGASSARQAADAIRALKDAREQAAYANQQAAQQTARAERQVTDAQRQAKKTQEDLNDAREQATRDLEDMNNSLVDARFAEEDAANAVADALATLNADKAAGSAVSEEQQRRDQLAYDEAVQALKEQQLQVQRLQTDTDAANKSGVDGSKTMVDARQNVADSNQNLSDQEQALADARVQQARTAAQGLESIQKATEALGGASGGAAGGVNKLAQAMAKLSPNARAFVLQVLALRGAWTALQQDVQNRLFQGLAVSLKDTATAVLPVLRTGLVQTAGALNAMALGAMTAARGVARDGTLGQAMASAAGGLRNLAGIPGIVIRAITQLAAAAGPAFQALTAAAGRGAVAIGEKLDAAFKSGRLKGAIDQAVALIKQMGVIAANVGRIIGDLFAPANASGAGFLNTVQTITRALADGLATPAAQEGLRSLFQTMSLIARTAGPLLVTAIQMIAPVLTALAPPVQQLVTALGAALGPILKQLGPVLVTVAGAFGQLVTGFQPVIAALPQLMGPLTQLVTALASSAPTVGLLVAAFNPFLGILILLAPVLDKLLGPIGTLITALTPLIDAVAVFAGQLAQSLVPVVAALSPVLGALADTVGAVLLALSPLLPVIGDLIAAILPVFTPILKGLSTVFLRLAGPIGQIARALGTALQPVIEGLSEVIDDLAAKYLSTLMGIFDQLIPLVPVLTPVLIQLGISIGQILEAVAPLVPQFAMLTVMLVSQLLPAIIPLIPPLAQLTTMLLILATDVITGVVVPALSGLIKFFGGLQKAFQPAIDAVKWLTTGIAALFEWLSDHLVGHSVIPDMVRSIVGWFAGLPGKAVAALGNIAVRLGNVMVTATNRMINAVSTGCVPWCRGWATCRGGLRPRSATWAAPSTRAGRPCYEGSSTASPPWAAW